MKQYKTYLQYEAPDDSDILDAYINKNIYRKSDARKIKRQLIKLGLYK